MSQGFSWALEQLRGDKRVRRRHWPKDEYLMLKFYYEPPQKPSITHHRGESSKSEWKILHEDVLSDDWEIWEG